MSADYGIDKAAAALPAQAPPPRQGDADGNNQVTLPESMLQARRVGTVEILTLSRPHSRNALPRTFFADLSDLLSQAVATGARAIVLGAAGSVFSAGADLRELATIRQPEDIQAHVEATLDGLDIIDRCPIPIIAAVNGGAYGVALALLLTCDAVVAASDTTFSFREVAHGVIPAAAILRVQSSFNRRWARWAILTCASFDATTGRVMGLVHQVCAPGEADRIALEIAARITDHPGGASRAAKALLMDTELRRETIVDAVTGLRQSAQHQQQLRSEYETPPGAAPPLPASGPS